MSLSVPIELKLFMSSRVLGYFSLSIYTDRPKMHELLPVLLAYQINTWAERQTEWTNSNAEKV